MAPKNLFKWGWFPQFQEGNAYWNSSSCFEHVICFFIQSISLLLFCKVCSNKSSHIIQNLKMENWDKKGSYPSFLNFIVHLLRIPPKKVTSRWIEWRRCDLWEPSSSDLKLLSNEHRSRIPSVWTFIKIDKHESIFLRAQTKYECHLVLTLFKVSDYPTCWNGRFYWYCNPVSFPSGQRF